MTSGEQIIHLNVGGSLFTTNRQTLLRHKDSVIARILSEGPTDELENSFTILADGSLFIDRDGFLFAYILEYLRLGKLILPEQFQNFARLREEAQFYQLDELKQLIESYNVNKYASLTDGTATSSSETGTQLVVVLSLG